MKINFVKKYLVENKVKKLLLGIESGRNFTFLKIISRPHISLPKTVHQHNLEV